MIVLCLRVFAEFKWTRALQSSARRTLPWPQFSQTLGSIGQAIWGLLRDTANLARASLRFRSLVFQARSGPEKLVGTRGFPTKIFHLLPSTKNRRIPKVFIRLTCLNQFGCTVKCTICAQPIICGFVIKH